MPDPVTLSLSFLYQEINVAILSVYTDLEDRVYEKKLTDFLKRRYGHVMCLFSVHKGEDEAFEKTAPLKGIYLYDRELSKEEEIQKRLLYGRLVRISPEEGIDPYQSADMIARKILGHAAMYNEVKEESSAPAKGKAIAVYSACGGIGVSTLAFSLAKVLSEEGPTLLMPLSLPSSLERFVRFEAEGSVSDLFYIYLTEGAEMLALKLEEVKVTSPEGFVYVTPCEYLGDIDLLDPQEVTEIGRILKTAFKYIVLDFPTIPTQGIREMIQTCEVRLELVDLSEEGEAKRKSIGGSFPPPTQKVSRKKGPKRGQRNLFDDGKPETEICLSDVEIVKKPDGTLDVKEDSPYMRKVRNMTDDLFWEDGLHGK